MSGIQAFIQSVRQNQTEASGLHTKQRADATMIKIEDYPYPSGLDLLKRWQAGDAEARREMSEIFDAAIAGNFDANFAVPAPSNEIHATASVHMLALAVLFDLYGIESEAYYKTDPYRYVRANLTVSRLLGAQKLYMTWALYALTCEPLGQLMMYPDRFPPGADPDAPLINKDNWRDLGTPDFTTGAPKAIDDIMRVTEELTGMAPLLQISAPYSLAADIYGQEPLLADVVKGSGQRECPSGPSCGHGAWALDGSSHRDLSQWLD